MSYGTRATPYYASGGLDNTTITPNTGTLTSTGQQTDPRLLSTTFLTPGTARP